MSSSDSKTEHSYKQPLIYRYPCVVEPATPSSAFVTMLYEEEDTCICGGGYLRQTSMAFKRDLQKRQKRPATDIKCLFEFCTPPKFANHERIRVLEAVRVREAAHVNKKRDGA